MNDEKCCNNCDKNRVLCKNLSYCNNPYYKVYNESDKTDKNLLKRIVFELRSKLLLSFKYDFYLCELNIIEENDEQILKFLQENDIQVSENLVSNDFSFMMYEYYGREITLDHFRTGKCIILNRTSIIWDEVGIIE